MFVPERVERWFQPAASPTMGSHWRLPDWQCEARPPQAIGRRATLREVAAAGDAITVWCNNRACGYWREHGRQYRAVLWAADLATMPSDKRSELGGASAVHNWTSYSVLRLPQAVGKPQLPEPWGSDDKSESPLTECRRLRTLSAAVKASTMNAIAMTPIPIASLRRLSNP